SRAARAAREAWAEAGGTVVPAGEKLPAADVIVDALFGIGLSRPLEGAAAALVRAINGHPAPVLALDVPSGVDADTGHATGIAIDADHTLEFLAPKAGLRTGAARDLAGTLSLADLQVPSAGVDASAERLNADDLARWLLPRRRDSHKGLHGRVLCIGGDHGLGGAVMLAAEAALRT
ncbi:NAD(P)H-hydrate epimerase, partial [Novilysobacter defluvii]